MRTNHASHRPRTRLARAGTQRSEFGECSEALFLTQSFVYPTAEEAERRFAEGDGYVYSRLANPTVDMFCRRLSACEDAEAACAFASGMAAVTGALLSQLAAGDHLVASRALFGSCQYVVAELLPRLGIGTDLVDGTDLEAWRDAVRPETRVFFVETPGNPTLDVLDIEAIAEIAAPRGIHVVVDNALASPVVQHPLNLGADSVVYSATKHIDGHGRCIGGAVIGSETFIRARVRPFLTHTGGALSPFAAWNFLKSLESLELRVAAQTETALRLSTVAAEFAGVRVRYPFLESHPQHAVARRQMDSGGTMLTVDFADGRAAAFRFLNALRLVSISNNFGDARTLATHPATTTHRRLDADRRREIGISEGLVRISAGLEDAEDLAEDLSGALRRATGGAA